MSGYIDDAIFVRDMARALRVLSSNALEFQWVRAGVYARSFADTKLDADLARLDGDALVAARLDPHRRQVVRAAA